VEGKKNLGEMFIPFVPYCVYWHHIEVFSYLLPISSVLVYGQPQTYHADADPYLLEYQNCQYVWRQCELVTIVIVVACLCM